MLRLSLALVAIIVLASCLTERISDDRKAIPEQIRIPAGFPPLSFPEGNTYSPERWALGKELFYDTSLSIDSTVSCASCHKPEYAFGDNLPTTPGVFSRPGTRNVPSLANVAYHPSFLREGSVPTLEMQVLVPIAEHNEFGFNVVKIVERLATDLSYQRKAKEAYGRSLDAFVLTRSIALFERSLLSGESRFDRHLRGTPSVLSPEEKQGMELFFSTKTNCATCHTGPLLTSFGFANTGLYEEYNDPGRFRLTGKEEDRAVFKIPGLRNLGGTAPYMHDGSKWTLEDVVRHYNEGGKDHPNKHPLIRPLSLTEKEQKAIVAFLLTLDDPDFIQNPLFRK